MRSEDFEFLYNLEENFWWFVGMRAITDVIAASLLEAGAPLRILDAGCGTGINLRHYEEMGPHEVYGLDLAADAVEWVRRRGFRRVAQASVTEIPFASGVFDLVFSFDVMGQVPPESSDEGFREMYRVLKPGGNLFIRAAAFEWMRSSHDEELATRHRFNRAELARKLSETGFTVKQSTYANTFLFPVVVLKRLLKFAGIGRGTDVKPLPGGLQWLDPVFRRMLLYEAALVKSGRRLPFGLSVICFAQRPPE
jgi:SAM-dependent methyltransferase